ncbi:YceI family protein [Leptospira ilyithenensis]|uniref:YceI family protein n=1 Tax=Leptospira ilyithenensis TaxID=2484901 RepID=A0A4R9LNC9_9LEPT|nr:YceI family protein [Leptospira ilyithenensis]TGN08227.1 YceI family protein [Leptospira ilyithenensis]
MKYFALLFLISGITFTSAIRSESKRWTVNSGKVYFKSESSLETITGEGMTVSGWVDGKSKQIYIEVNLKDLKTPNRLQTSHLHDNYLETGLYPLAIFSGSVSEIKEQGEVKATGSLELHGKKKENVSLTGNLKKDSGSLELLSYFTIKLEDYNIQVPQLLIMKINPEIQVKVKLSLISE